MVTVPEGLRVSVSGAEGGDEWLKALPELVTRAAARWRLTLGRPFEDGMSAWTAPAATPTGRPAVLKISYPHSEARHEAAALRIWAGRGAVRVIDSHDDDWALLLERCTPGGALRDAGLEEAEHLRIGADLLGVMGTVSAPVGGPFPVLVEVAANLAAIATDRLDRLAASAPVPLDRGLLTHGIELLRSLPIDPPWAGLTHGDLNPGNILRDDRADRDDRDDGADRDDSPGSAGWIAIDPKSVVGDLAWDPWPLITQIGEWTTTAVPGSRLAERTRLVSDVTGLDPARIAAWSTARSVESALWAADRGWWTGSRGADGDLVRARAWADAATILGGD